MKKQSVALMIMGWLLSLPLLFSPGYSVAADLSFLSYDSQDMIGFDLPFKQYIASYKIFIEKEKGLESLAEAMSKWEAIFAKAKKQGADEAILGRMSVVKGLLLQAQGLAVQGRCDEALELSVPLRSEIFELHRALNMLTSEDYMIFFHNGVMHRAEPLIEERRYLELEMLIPLIEDTVTKFKNPPKGVTDVEQYNKRYEALMEQVKAYIDTIRQVNNSIDPEYGAYMLAKRLEDAHAQAHKKFGAVYLSFPEGMIWPKKN